MSRVWGGGPGQRPALDVGAGSACWRPARGDLLAQAGLVLPTSGVPGEDVDRNGSGDRAAGMLDRAGSGLGLEQVGARDAAVSAVAAQLGVAWWTIMNLTIEQGTPIVEDPQRLADVDAIGVDETAYLRATGRHPTWFATGITDLTPGRPARLLDVVEGRSGTVLGDWLAARDPAWQTRITTASLDPFRGYATALATRLPDATRVLDPFHVVKLGLTCVDDVRRRVQHGNTGHRGRTGDPLFGIRRVLRRRHDRVSTKARARLETGLIAGDPTGETTLAWTVAQDLMALYQLTDPEQARARATELITNLRNCPIPEIAKLGRTLHAWREELLAHSDHPDVSNGPTENLKARPFALSFKHITLGVGHAMAASIVTTREPGSHCGYRAKVSSMSAIGGLRGQDTSPL
ncbi:MAG: ISL3 family transposase [Pseudonocardiaceae bacterium]